MPCPNYYARGTRSRTRPGQLVAKESAGRVRIVVETKHRHMRRVDELPRVRQRLRKILGILEDEFDRDARPILNQRFPECPHRGPRSLRIEASKKVG